MPRRPAALLLALALAGCGAGATPESTGTGGSTGPTGPAGPIGPTPLVLVAEGKAGAWTVQIQADRLLGTGLVPLSIRVTSAEGVAITDASLTLEARRPASGLVAPVSNGPRIADDGTYHADVSIAEAASAAEGWVFRIEVTRSGETASATLPGVPVLERHLAGTFAGEGGTVVLAVRFASGLRTGTNPITVTLHQVVPGSGRTEPVVDATLHAVPYMPSMGHGSSGSVAPVPTGTPGVYVGSLFFSMAGDWETTFVVERGGAEIGRVAVTVVF